MIRSIEPTILSDLRTFARRLIDPASARVAVAPERPERGYWFGGGKMAVGPDGRLYLTGRYRSAGDSRTGLDLGDRGRELAVFASSDGGRSWDKVLSFDKAAAAPDDAEVLSIEGSALRFSPGRVDLFVSSEKRVPYPAPVEAFRKPGTGIWTIERLSAPTLEGLAGARPRTILSSDSPATLQVKDPFLAERPGHGPFLFFCHHSFNWSSSGTGYLPLGADGEPEGKAVFDAWPRGPAWDVAITRGTCVLPLPEPPPGASTSPSDWPAGLGLAFYDGGECLRNLDEHAAAVRRPRGYSCEELGGLGYFVDGDPTTFLRISEIFPEFTSPDGTGCLRYVDVLAAPDAFIATWQQSRPDGSQALMINRVERREVRRGAGLLKFNTV